MVPFLFRPTSTCGSRQTSKSTVAFVTAAEPLGIVGDAVGSGFSRRVCVCVSLLALLCVRDGRHGALTLAHVTDARPLAVHRLLPQGDLQRHRRRTVTPLRPLATTHLFWCLQRRHLVVSSGNRQDVSRDGPADVPNHVVELVQQLGRPRVPRRVVARPDEDAPVLRERGQKVTQALGSSAEGTFSPESSWRWCWSGGRSKEPSPHPSPSRCEPPASDPPSTGRPPLWRQQERSVRQRPAGT